MDEIKKIRIVIESNPFGYHVLNEPMHIQTFVIDECGNIQAKKEIKYLKDKKRIAKCKKKFNLDKQTIKDFFGSIRNVARNAKYHEVYPCDSGGMIKIFYKLDYHTEELSLWTSVEEGSKPLYSSVGEFIKNNKLDIND